VTLIVEITAGSKIRITEKRRSAMKKIAIAFLLLGLVMVFVNPKTASCGLSGARPAEAALDLAKNKSISRILPVLESRVHDQKLRRKAIDKLVTLDVNRLRLISSLCDKIAVNGTSAGSDIAFSLVSIIIIVS
jgi:hypothetical protein